MLLVKSFLSGTQLSGKQFIIGLGLFSTFSAAQASDTFWQDPLKSSYTVVEQSTESQNSMALNRQVSRDFYNPYNDTEQTALSFTNELSDNNTIAFEYANAQKQRSMMFGFTHKNVSVSYMNGAGEDYASITGSYAGVDPYLFHGGWQQNFRYQGYALDYAVKGIGHLQFGQAKVQAYGLLSRQASYMEWSNQRFFARATQFARGSDKIGNGFDAGFAFAGNKQIAFQSMQLDNGRSLQRIRLQLNGNKTRQYWLDLSEHKNDLYRDNNDFQIMFSFKTQLGLTPAMVSHAAKTDPQAQQAKPKNKGLQRGLFIGAGVAAAASLSSSGSSSQDETPRFRSQRDAAFDVLDGINPRSVRENREYGGWVFLNNDGSYAWTTPVSGDNSSVRLPSRAAVISQGSRATASYHTHAGFDPRYDNENFSSTDLESDRAAGVDGYLATPGGQFKFHDLSTGSISTLGSISN